MNEPLRIEPLAALPGGVDDMRVEAAEEGFGFVEKLVAEWRSGVNRFIRTGEVLLGAFQADALIAVGGLNRDPYTAESGVGRLRHLYVRKSARRTGMGTALVRQLLGRAEGTFRSVRLRTATQEGADFYARLGFHAVQSETATHAWLSDALGSAGVGFHPRGRRRPGGAAAEGRGVTSGRCPFSFRPETGLDVAR